MGFFEAFVDELDKIATTLPPAAVGAARKKGMVRRIREWIQENPGKSGIAAGWILRGLFSGGGE